MKKRLLFVITVLAAALFLPTPEAAAARSQCFSEHYGDGQCGTTCVIYNDQGNIDKYATYLHAC